MACSSIVPIQQAYLKHHRGDNILLHDFNASPLHPLTGLVRLSCKRAMRAQGEMLNRRERLVLA
jgi:hypothetical protein